MIRYLTRAPKGVDLRALRAAVPDAEAVNEVDVDGVAHVAVYWADERDGGQEAWERLVRANPKAPANDTLRDRIDALRSKGDRLTQPERNELLLAVAEVVMNRRADG